MTVLIAIVLALGVPFAQLHTIDVRIECCCPSPEVCKCPDHKDDGAPRQPMMQACHKTVTKHTGGVVSTFVAPLPVAIDALPPVIIGAHHALPVAHAPPAPRRPDAPS